MSKILAGVFLGVFVSALFYEIFQRQEPEMAGKFATKIKDKFNSLMEPNSGVMEN
ncbi:hypothetical protein [Candidatus Magnetominusculus xianensis]|uniref:Magnetosome protein Man3 n=1 Tax=Candidatus Magnetominusculus xianensis TaxID=1748249 RepID=A0ABR5SJL4_9BACT|nr:hypothetical protein [Candidatus Magnetominusculus xianensis]KWT94829.1 magnetosome protein Man3 [Candidatus Magnetominusculus xianensis]MBF0404721.1 hypothetical protein [Nitrospirota bacterium]